MGDVKTTLDLPADLLRTVKIRAVEENRRIKDMVAELLRRGLAQSDEAFDGRRSRVSFPLVRTGDPVAGQELTTQGLADLLTVDEAEPHHQ